LSKRVYLLPGILALGAALLSANCQKSERQRLIEESPFRQRSPEADNSIIFVSCTFQPLEAAGEIDITQQQIWRDYALSTEEPIPAEKGVEKGFSAAQVRLWRENGLEIAVVPLSNWKQFLEEMLKIQCAQMPVMTALYRRPGQAAEFPFYWITQPASPFICDAQGNLQGYSLYNGRGFIRVNCMPAEDPASKTAYLKLIPFFRHAIPEEKIVQDKLGPKIVREYPEIAFEQLELEGALREGYFICISTRPEETFSGKLGNLFMRHNVEGREVQLMLMIAPQIQTATEIKTQNNNLNNQ